MDWLLLGTFVLRDDVSQRKKQIAKRSSHAADAKPIFVRLFGQKNY